MRSNLIYDFCISNGINLLELMVVKELIEKLKQLDKDAPIMLNLDDDRIGCDIYDIDIDVLSINGIVDVYLIPQINWLW